MSLMKKEIFSSPDIIRQQSNNDHHKDIKLLSTEATNDITFPPVVSSSETVLSSSSSSLLLLQHSPDKSIIVHANDFETPKNSATTFFDNKSPMKSIGPTTTTTTELPNVERKPTKEKKACIWCKNMNIIDANYCSCCGQHTKLKGSEQAAYDIFFSMNTGIPKSKKKVKRKKESLITKNNNNNNRKEKENGNTDDTTQQQQQQQQQIKQKRKRPLSSKAIIGSHLRIPMENTKNVKKYRVKKTIPDGKMKCEWSQINDMYNGWDMSHEQEKILQDLRDQDVPDKWKLTTNGNDFMNKEEMEEREKNLLLDSLKKSPKNNNKNKNKKKIIDHHNNLPETQEDENENENENENDRDEKITIITEVQDHLILSSAVENENAEKEAVVIIDDDNNDDQEEEILEIKNQSVGTVCKIENNDNNDNNNNNNNNNNNTVLIEERTEHDNINNNNNNNNININMNSNSIINDEELTIKDLDLDDHDCKETDIFIGFSKKSASVIKSELDNPEDVSNKKTCCIQSEMSKLQIDHDSAMLMNKIRTYHSPYQKKRKEEPIVSKEAKCFQFSNNNTKQQLAKGNINDQLTSKQEQALECGGIVVQNVVFHPRNYVKWVTPPVTPRPPTPEIEPPPDLSIQEVLKAVLCRHNSNFYVNVTAQPKRTSIWRRSQGEPFFEWYLQFEVKTKRIQALTEHNRKPGTKKTEKKLIFSDELLEEEAMAIFSQQESKEWIRMARSKFKCDYMGNHWKNLASYFVNKIRLRLRKSRPSNHIKGQTTYIPPNVVVKMNRGINYTQDADKEMYIDRSFHRWGLRLSWGSSMRRRFWRWGLLLTAEIMKDCESMLITATSLRKEVGGRFALIVEKEFIENMLKDEKWYRNLREIIETNKGIWLCSKISELLYLCNTDKGVQLLYYGGPGPDGNEIPWPEEVLDYNLNFESAVLIQNMIRNRIAYKIGKKEKNAALEAFLGRQKEAERKLRNQAATKISKIIRGVVCRLRLIRAAKKLKEKLELERKKKELQERLAKERKELLERLERERLEREAQELARLKAIEDEERTRRELEQLALDKEKARLDAIENQKKQSIEAANRQRYRSIQGCYENIVSELEKYQFMKMMVIDGTDVWLGGHIEEMDTKITIVEIIIRDLKTNAIAKCKFNPYDLNFVLKKTGKEFLVNFPYIADYSELFNAIVSELTLFYSRQGGVMVLTYIGKIVKTRTSAKLIKEEGILSKDDIHKKFG